MCAEAALTSDGHTGRTYDLTGPEALSNHDIASGLASYLGRPVRYIDVPPAGFLGALQSSGIPPWLATDLVAMNERFAVGDGADVTGDVEGLTGHAARGFEAFLQDFGTGFRS